jgi:hypothetical protein
LYRDRDLCDTMQFDFDSPIMSLIYQAVMVVRFLLRSHLDISMYVQTGESTLAFPVLIIIVT